MITKLYKVRRIQFQIVLKKLLLGVSLAGLSHPATEEGEPLMSGRYVALLAYTKADKGKDFTSNSIVADMFKTFKRGT